MGPRFHFYTWFLFAETQASCELSYISFRCWASRLKLMCPVRVKVQFCTGQAITKQSLSSEGARRLWEIPRGVGFLSCPGLSPRVGQRLGIIELLHHARSGADFVINFFPQTEVPFGFTLQRSLFYIKLTPEMKSAPKFVSYTI